jgi:hypothetical protein
MVGGLLALGLLPALAWNGLVQQGNASAFDMLLPKTKISVMRETGIATRTMVGMEAIRAADVRVARTDTNDLPNSCGTQPVRTSGGSGLGGMISSPFPLRRFKLR